MTKLANTIREHGAQVLNDLGGQSSRGLFLHRMQILAFFMNEKVAFLNTAALFLPYEQVRMIVGSVARTSLSESAFGI